MSFLAGEVGEGDVCISMGCGDIATLPDEVLARRAARKSNDRDQPHRCELRPGRQGDQQRQAWPGEGDERRRRRAVLGERAERDVSLAPFTTYRLGGPAALLVERAPSTTSPLVAAARRHGASGARRRARVEPPRRRRRASPGSPFWQPHSVGNSSSAPGVRTSTSSGGSGWRCRRRSPPRAAGGVASNGPWGCPARSAEPCG